MKKGLWIDGVRVDGWEGGLMCTKVAGKEDREVSLSYWDDVAESPRLETRPSLMYDTML